MSVVAMMVVGCCCACLVAALAGRDPAAPRDNNFGTALYGPGDAAVGRTWTDRERAGLLCRMSVGRLVPTRTPDDARVLLDYFALVGNMSARYAGTAKRRRALRTAAADALGGYLYAEVLPRVRMLYYEGRSDYPTTRRLHDLAKNIKYDNI